MEGDNPGSWIQRFQDQFEQHPEATEAIQASPKTNNFVYFLRSVLFSPIPSKSRVYINNQLLSKQRGIMVRFTGMPLSQADLAIWDALLYLVQKQSSKNVCLFTRDSILKLMRLPANADYYKALERSIEHLALAMFKLENDSHIYTGKLVQYFEIDHKTGKFMVHVNPDLIQIRRKDSVEHYSAES
jgi:hypothetical protein